MSRVERWQPLLVLLAAAGGLALDTATGAGRFAEPVVLPALMALLGVVFVQVSVRQIGQAARRRRVVAASLVVNFVWVPLLAWLLGAALLGGHPQLRLGLLILLVTPCTDWYLAFTTSARGDVALATALLPLNLALQLALLPVFLLTLGGVLVAINAVELIGTVALVVGVPAAVAAAVRMAGLGRRERPGLGRREGPGLGRREGPGSGRGPDWFDRAVAPRLGPISVGLLCVAITAMFAAHGSVLLERPAVVAVLLPALGVFFVVAYALAQALASTLGLAHAQRATLTMTTMARNSPLALAVAVAGFPGEPLIALALVAAPLVELPVLALAAQRLARRGESPCGGGR